MNQYPIVVQFNGKPALITFFGKNYEEAKQAADKFSRENG